MITQEEKQRRQELINFALGNVRFEGVVLSNLVEAINQRYINGEIDKSEHSQLCIQQMKKEVLQENTNSTQELAA